VASPTLSWAELAEILPGQVLLIDANDCVVEASATLADLRSALAAGDPVPLTDLVDAPDETVTKFLAMARRARQPIPGKLAMRQRDGTTITFQARGARIGPPDANIVGVFLQNPTVSSKSDRFNILNTTIDQLKVEIERRRHVESMLEAEKETLASVFKGSDLREALGILARAVEANSGGMLVSILLSEDGRLLRHLVAPGLPQMYTEAIDGLEIGPNVGSCGTAAHTGEMVIVSDIQADPKWEPFREVAAAADLRACWSAPILASNDEVLGTLAMYYRTPREPTAAELVLISNSAYVASIAIERFRSQEMLTDLLIKEQQGREQAEAQNAAKDEFLAMLGHELRNPLAAITNATLTLKAQREAEATSGASADSFLDIILGESSLLKRILDDLLDIGRLSRGKLQLRKATMDLDDFAAQIRKTAPATYPQRKLAFDIQEDLGFIVADLSRIRQSIQNLLDNAVKYSSEDDLVTLSISATDELVTFTVADTGDGIDAKLAETIFDPFVQLDNSIARTNSGLGLGLALVSQFTKMHGGQITLHSEGKGQGSRFTITIPRGEPDDAPAPAPGEDRPAPTASSKKVLVVEDNEGAREGLCQLLELWGHTVSSAADGREALALFASDPPDIALVDIGLPEFDGYEVAARVRQQSGGDEIHLVALTGYGLDTDRARALEAGFDDHLVKPAEVQELMAILGPPQ
jgi:signal transduction histidine kinase